MHKLKDLIGFAEGVKANDWSELRECMKSKDPTKKDMMPFYSYRVGIFEDIVNALTVFKEVIDHLKVDVDTSDHDYYDKIVGVDYKLEFDNENPEELDKALELLDWFDNEHVYPEDMEEENGRK